MAGSGLPREGAHRWLIRARSNLARAELAKVPEMVLEDYCFDAHQAAEKALKSVLIANGARPPRSHDLGELVGVLAKRGLPAPPHAAALARLNRHAVEARYPGTAE